MIRVRNLSTLLSVCVLATACSSDDVVGTPGRASFSIQLPQTQEQLNADLVARGFAAAMSDPAIRLAVRDAMRASPLTEHKLGFQEFLHSRTGAALAATAAQKLSITPGAFSSAVAKLPAMDFYVPDQAERQTWNGSAAVRVGYLLNADGERAPAYDPAGAMTRFVDGIGSAGQASFLIERAERKARRIRPQAGIPGDVIQDANDGTIGGAVVEHLPDGTIKETELADIYMVGPVIRTSRPVNLDFGASNTSIPGPRFIVPCDNNCGGGGGGAPPDTTWLHEVEVIHVCDNGICSETNEFEWHTYYSANSGATWSNRLDLRIVGIGSTSYGVYNYIAIFKKPVGYNEMLQSDVVETDGISGDDHFVPSPQWSNYENNGVEYEGSPRCGYTRANGLLASCSEAPWKEVQQTMIWH